MLTALVRIMQLKVVRFGFLAAVLVLLAAALADQGGALWQHVQELSVAAGLLALAVMFIGELLGMMLWRELLADLGSRLSLADTYRIMFIGQLAKYLPGSIWALVAQAELAADYGVPRSRSAMSVVVARGVLTCSSALVAAATLPFAASGSLARYWWVLLIIPVGITALIPPVLNRILRLLMRLTHQPADSHGVSWPGLARTLGWSAANWVFWGLSTYVVMRQLAGGGPSTVALAIGAFALSWCVGSVAVFVPVGAGVRDLALVAVLATQTTWTVALTVALLVRALNVVCDVLAGALAAALIGRSRLRRFRQRAAERA
jgi:glycosyltransferase 2 family protein